MAIDTNCEVKSTKHNGHYEIVDLVQTDNYTPTILDLTQFTPSQQILLPPTYSCSPRDILTSDQIKAQEYVVAEGLDRFRTKGVKGHPSPLLTLKEAVDQAYDAVIIGDTIGLDARIIHVPTGRVFSDKQFEEFYPKREEASRNDLQYL